MGYIYPPPAPTFSGDTLQIHRFLQTPAQVARRVQTLLMQRYIADVLLSQRLRVAGGAITYESGEPLGTEENPRAVAPGSEYSLVKIGEGTPSVAKTTKWGQDTEVTDESIARQLMSPVNRALGKLANQNVSHVDSVALSAIATAVTATQAATAQWTLAGTDAEVILTDALTARANLIKLNLGFDPNAVVLDDLTYAVVKAKFIAAGYLPREGSANAIASGDFPNVEGMVWMPTSNGFANTALIADRDQLGGMADEDLQSPGYAKASAPGTTGVEVKSIRKDDEDKYRLRARRVTVPVILEPAAARKITGVSA